jgi:hypothetical protein
MAQRSGKAPVWKNPWVVGWVVGMVVITGIRPFLRRIPEPPPVLAQAGSVVFTVDGAEWTPATPTSGATLMVLTGASPSESSESLRLLRKLSVVSAAAGFDEVRFVVGSPAVPDGSKWAAAMSSQLGVDTGPPWIFATGAGVEAIASTVEPWTGGRPATSGVILLDEAGQVRGFYGSDSYEALSEVYHRARHVVRPPSEDV